MTKSFLFTVIALVFVIGNRFEAQTQNIVVNGNLESWTAGAPDGWGIFDNISQETTTVHGGSSSAKHTSTTSSKKLSQDLSGIEEGQEYTISYWYYDNDGAARTRIWSYWLSGGNTIPDNEPELRPTVYSSDNSAWQHFEVVLTAPATADGFRFEVRVYQENSTSGGAVYYDDFEFNGDITIYPEPTNYPTAFEATAGGFGINLSWTDATGAQLPSGYIIYAGIASGFPIPSDGEPVPNDNDLSDGNGAINIDFGVQAASFGGLESNTTYYFTIYSYTNSGENIDFKTDGTAPTGEATTSNISSLIFEDFEGGTLGIFTQYSAASNKDWINAEYQGNKYAYANGYGGDVASDDWLISPPMDLDNYSNEILVFETAKNFTDVIEGLEILISEDYAGTGDPGLATWDALTATLSTGGYAWTASGDIDLSAFSGDAVYLAFHYNSTGVAGGEAAAWEVDNVIITGEAGGSPDPEPSNYPTGFTATADGLAINLAWTDATGTQLPDKYIIYAGINSSLPVPVVGTPVVNDPDLSDGSAVINVNFGVEAASFSDLLPATTYYFTIYPYTNSGINVNYKTDGIAPSDDATTENIIIVTIEDENFNDSWGNWTTISIIGDQVWNRDNSFGVGGTPCASMSGYEGAPFANEDWLISPALNLNNYINEVISFQNAKNYTGNDLELKVSTDYDGGPDPNTATWTNLNFTFSPGGFLWTNSGDVDLSGLTGSAVYVAFYFTSTDTESATWEVDDIVITAEEEGTIDPEPSNYPTSFSADATGSTILVTWTDAIGTQLPDQYIIFAGTSASLPMPVDGTPVANDLDLSDGSGAFNVAYGSEDATFAGLDPGVTFYFVIYPFTNTGINTNYKTDGTAPTDNATTTFTPEPSNYPTLFSATATINSVNLTWTDATGGQVPEMYIIFAGTSASLPVPVDGTSVANDPDMSDGSGAVNIAYGDEQASFSGLTANTAYHFSIYPYTNSGANINFKTDGTAPALEITTTQPATEIIESENFNDSWGNWDPISVIGDQVWDRENTYGIENTPCARVSGFSGSSFENEDWLISPALVLDNYINEVMTFQNAKNYTGNDLELKISTDYVGGGSDPTTATWTSLAYTMSPGSWAWTSSGDIDLSGFNGTAVYVAFRFTSTNAESATWEIDDISITGEEDLSSDDQLNMDNLFRVYPNPSNGLISIVKPMNGFDKVTILSVSGSFIEEFKMSEAVYHKDLSALKTGIYFILFSDDQTGQTIAKKLIMN